MSGLNSFKSYLANGITLPRWVVFAMMIGVWARVPNDIRNIHSKYSGDAEFNPAENQNILAIANGGINLRESLVDMSPTAYQTLLRELHSDKGLGPYNNVISTLLSLENKKDEGVSAELIRAGINGVKSLKAEKAQALPAGWADCVEYSDSMSFILNQFGIINFEITGHLLSRNSVNSEMSHHKFLGIIDKTGKFYILECTSTSINCLKEADISYEDFKNGRPVIFNKQKVFYYGYGTDLSRLKEELMQYPEVIEKKPSPEIEKHGKLRSIRENEISTDSDNFLKSISR